MQKPILQLACLALLLANNSIFNQTFHTHGITSEDDILALPDEPNLKEATGTNSLQSLCSNLATDMDDAANTDEEFIFTHLQDLCYPILSSVHNEVDDMPA